MTKAYTFVGHRGNKIYVRGSDNNKPFTEIVEDYQPTFYSHSKDKSSPFQSYITGIPLKPEPYAPGSKFKEIVKNFSDYPCPIYGRKNVSHSYIFDTFINNQPEIIADINNVGIGIIDIEVHAEKFPKPEEAEYPITAISYYCSRRDKMFLFHYTEWDENKSEILGKLDCELIETKCKDERELLREFIKCFSESYPDIISGWNSDGFDCLYVANRVEQLFGTELLSLLSPFGMVYFNQRVGRFRKKMDVVEFFGITQLDYQRLYQKHTFIARENYQLDTIAQVELGEGKLSYEEKMSLHTLYKTDPQKYIDYNIKDVYLVKKLDEKLNLFKLVVDMAYMTGVNFDVTFSPVNIWDNLVHNRLESTGVIPKMFYSSDAEAFHLDGAHVHAAKRGRHKWVVSFDLASLYPSIVRQWNLGPETKMQLPGCKFDTNMVKEFLKLKTNDEMREGLKAFLTEHDASIAATNIAFSNKHDSVFRECMAYFFDARREAKQLVKKYDAEGNENMKKAMNTRQMALKILANSGYGALASKYFRFYDGEIAASITLTGQLVSMWLFSDINDYINEIIGTEDVDYIIAGDTDSVYLNFDPFVRKFFPNKSEAETVELLIKVADRFEEKCIQPAYESLQYAMNCDQHHMVMEREIIGSDAFWRKKKNYAIRVLNEDGKSLVGDPKYKILGLEAIKSSFNSADRNAMKKAVEIILDPTKDNDDLLEFIEAYHKEYINRLPEDVASAGTVNYISKYSDTNGEPKKGTPQNSKAAIAYNKLIQEYGLDHLPQIQEGDKIYFVELKIPNPIKKEVVGFLDFLPPEFDLHDYVDREGLFRKNFYNPVKSFCKAVDWKSEDVPDLNSFF